MNQLVNATLSDSRISAPAPASASANLDKRIAIICSQWHREIVHRARDALIDEFTRNKFASSDIELFEVPGAFEIPLFAKRLAVTGDFNAIVACGLVVDGGIYRHEFVAASVIDGLMQVQLACDVPIFSVVLTPKAFHDHEEHRQFFAEHFVKKGVEAARTCVQALSALQSLGNREKNAARI